MTRVVGLDIGGANLKAADSDGNAVARPFAVWKAPDRLAAELECLLRAFVRPDLIAVTMTAELADCFATKQEGIDKILSAVEQSAGEIPIVVWQTAGCFVSPATAREAPLLVAAANWHALATFVGRLAPQGTALLVDIGTTTTDLIPIRDGVPVPVGRTDRERLESGELVYTGVRRTPVCAIVSAVPLDRGENCPLAAELFATALDVYLTLGEIAEDPHDTDTANGRPATIAAAHDRLARSVCCDRSEVSSQDAARMAAFIAKAQRGQVAAALDRILARQTSVPGQIMIILSGSGSFLGERVIADHEGLQAAKVVRLSELFGSTIADAACAYAVARLAAEQVDTTSC